MKIFRLLILALLALVSCVKDLEYRDGNYPSAPEGATVTIPFSVTLEERVSPATKAVVLGEDPTLDNLYIAVFGSSGYLKEYVKAQNIQQSGTVHYIGIDNEEHDAITYTFEASLTISENKRILHFIGNGPSTLSFGYADAVMPALLSENGAKAYWQMKTVNNIEAKRSTVNSSTPDANGNYVVVGDYIDKDGNKIVNGKGYVPDDNIVDALSNVQLVRNWAKIEVTSVEGSNFTLHSFAVVNVPSRGAVTPHSASTGFVQDYQTMTFNTLKDYYPANLPPGTLFDKSIPSASAFEAGTIGEEQMNQGVAGAGGAVYLYERPVPTAKLPPSSVIVYGFYDNPEDQGHKGWYYYKVDLMEKDVYYPVLRNFKYKIEIAKIMSQGHHTPESAAAAAGSANVSADINASHLSDISNGVGRLIIKPWMAHTYTVKEAHGQLECFFVDNVETWNINMDPAVVSITKSEMPNGVRDVILGDPVIDDPQTEAGSEGWRIIHFETDEPDATVRSQTLRIRVDYDNWYLYRDVVITLLSKQSMVARCKKPRIPAVKNTLQTLEIVIPEGLPESMFPLSFQIEPERMTLTPDATKDNNNLPVNPAPSISGNPEYSGKPSFHFIRSLSWDEYRTLDTERDKMMNTWRVLPCYFKTNCDDSATTIWVHCDYFDPVSTAFRNSVEFSFPNLAFTSSIKRGEGQPVTVHFDVAKDPEEDDFPIVYLFASGMTLETSGTTIASVPGSAGTYMMRPESSSVDLEFRTTSLDGDVYLRVYAEEYETQEISSHVFPSFGFVDGHKLWKTNAWSNVALNHVNTAANKTVLFGYEDDPEALNAEISINNLVGLTRLNPTEYPYKPDGPRSNNGKKTYHEIEFRTASPENNRAVSFTLAAPGYVEENIKAYRFGGNILTKDNINTSTVLKSDNSFGFSADAANPSFTVEQNTSKDGTSSPKVTFTFDAVTEIRATSTSGVSPNGLILKHTDDIDYYELTVTSLDSNYKIFFIQFTVNNSKWTGADGDGKSHIFAPREGVPGEGCGTFETYRGANDQFIWHIPEGKTSATIKLYPHEGYPISIKDIVFKSYRGNFYKND